MSFIASLFKSVKTVDLKFCPDQNCCSATAHLAQKYICIKGSFVLAKPNTMQVQVVNHCHDLRVHSIRHETTINVMINSTIRSHSLHQSMWWKGRSSVTALLTYLLIYHCWQCVLMLVMWINSMIQMIFYTHFICILFTWLLKCTCVQPVIGALQMHSIWYDIWYIYIFIMNSYMKYNR